MKKKWITGLLALAMVFSMISPVRVLADSQRVVTLGADLSDSQRKSILKYFGIKNLDEVQQLTITNKDEREHLASFISLEQIGTRTFSCAYVCPTNSGGIRVKTANLTYVTSNMIATTLSTAGIKNCDVIAASPIKVSGTGALTGVMMAYEVASGETLSQEKKDLATKEMIITEDLADDVGKDEAVEIINEIKIKIIEDKVKDDEEIEKIVDEILDKLDERKAAEDGDEDDDKESVFSNNNKENLLQLSKDIAAQDYEYEDMKDTLERVGENVGTEIQLTDGGDTEEEIVEPEVEEDSILNDTDDKALGEDVVSDSTNKEDNQQPETVAPVEEEEDDWDVVVGEDGEEAPIIDGGDPDWEEFSEDEEPVVDDAPEAEEPVEEPIEEEPVEEPVEEEPVEEAPAEITEAEAEVVSAGNVVGMVTILANVADARPVSGTITISGMETITVDLADTSRWAVSPMPQDELDQYGWLEGSAITVLTGQTDEAALSEDRAVTADFLVEDASGAQYHVSCGDDIAGSGTGVVITSGDTTGWTAGGFANGRLIADAGSTVEMEITNAEDGSVETQTFDLAEGSADFSVNFATAGLKVADVMFLDEEGGIYDAVTLVFSVK